MKVTRRGLFGMFGGSCAGISIANVKSTDLGPDDVLVVKVKEEVTEQTMYRLREEVTRAFGFRRVIIVDGGIEFEVWRNANGPIKTLP